MVNSRCLVVKIPIKSLWIPINSSFKKSPSNPIHININSLLLPEKSLKKNNYLIIKSRSFMLKSPSNPIKIPSNPSKIHVFPWFSIFFHGFCLEIPKKKVPPFSLSAASSCALVSASSREKSPRTVSRSVTTPGQRYRYYIIQNIWIILCIM